MKYTNISATERLEISILRSKGFSIRAIARSLGRGPNSISYELKRNRGLGGYDPKKANAKSWLRKRMRRLQWMKIEENPGLKQYSKPS